MKHNNDTLHKFKQEKNSNIGKQAKDKKLYKITRDWILKTASYKYTYNFLWLARPIIQYPQDIMALQEIIWETKPDLIIETGIAHGGGLIFYASMLELIGKGEVLGIDIDIREHNRKAIESHKMYKRITMIEGSSIEEAVIKKIQRVVKKHKNIMVCLDSLHTEEHVLNELNAYSKFVSSGNYLVVFDTIIEHMPRGCFKNRPWNKGNNPKTAVDKFLKTNKNFVIDKKIENKLLITVAPGGYLRKIS